MNGAPPLRGYPVDHGLRRSAAARRRAGLVRRAAAMLAGRRGHGASCPGPR
ncbi:MAG: hypothetical protein IT200_02510 [Thermoleophilia bacterium]|nr:hypothetical protein [Thermoleophilia bacterium]